MTDAVTLAGPRRGGTALWTEMQPGYPHHLSIFHACVTHFPVSFPAIRFMLKDSLCRGK
jgi:hypothetical protein